MLKTLLQTILVELWVKKFAFSVFSLPKLNFSTTVFGTTYLCTIVFKVDTDSIRKIAQNFGNC